MKQTRMRWAPRANERGAALFVVVLVVTLLMGIAAYAARSAHLAVASSGYERQMTQSRYVAEYALMIAQSKLANGGGQSYVSAMRLPSKDACSGQTGMLTPTCLKLFYSDIQGELGAQNLNVCEPSTATIPGSLGPARTECDFTIELTDKMAGMIPPGFAQSSTQTGASTLKFWYVTASVTGWVRLSAANTNADTANGSASTQTLRGRILAGPFNN